MPLFRAQGESGGAKARPEQRRKRKMRFGGRRCGKTEEDGTVASLTRLCLLSLADNMKDVWLKDYADNYLDHYSFRYIMGPFSLLPGELVEELISLMCTRKEMSRAAIHLLLVPQLRALSLEKCPGLVTSALCAHITGRCQDLRCLDLSGAQQLPSKTLSETVRCLPALRSLSLAGTPCDRCVISVITHHCRLLRHLDVTRCHLLSPAALLLLGGGVSFSSSRSAQSTSASQASSSCSAPLPPLPLISLLAMDIGFGEQEEDPVAAAAYLLLSLPCLERVAMEGLGKACALIQHQEFMETDGFTDREGVPRLEEVWRERSNRQGTDSWQEKREGAAAGEGDEEEEGEEEERGMWEEYGSESEENASRDEGPMCSQTQTRRRALSGDDRLILRLKDVQGVSCDYLESLSRACPNIHSIAMNVDDDDGDARGSLFAAGLRALSGQLRSLLVQYPGPVVVLFPGLKVAGSSLTSLTLEGVTTSPHTPLLDIIKACPRLRDLFISAEPPTSPQEEEDEEDQQDDRDLPQLPNLCSLTLNFSYEHSQVQPVMSWMSLKRVIKCLLAGSPLLEELSLVSLPCPVDCVLQNVLQACHFDQHKPLGRVRRINLPRTDVQVATLTRLMRCSERLEYIDVSYGWRITWLEWEDCRVFRKIKVVWV